jgi:hypothetical protein
MNVETNKMHDRENLETAFAYANVHYKGKNGFSPQEEKHFLN